MITGGRVSKNGVLFMFANEAFKRFIQPKPGEQALILTDCEAESDLIDAFAAAATATGAEPTVIVMPPTLEEGIDRPLTRIALEAINGADIYIPLSATTSLAVHSTEVTKACLDKTRSKNMRMFLAGGRYNAGFYGQSWKYMLEALTHDYTKVAEWCNKFSSHMKGKKQIHITSDAGSDFTASIEGVDHRLESGFATKPGDIACVPGGEVWGGPREFTAEGVIAIDGPIAYVAHKPVLSQPVLVTVKKGRAVDIKGGQEAEALKKWMDRYENADVLAEVSLAANPFLKQTGEINIIDKRVLGTIHVAFGENMFQIYPYGTNWSPVHADMLLRKPSCWVDGVQLLDKGVPVV